MRCRSGSARRRRSGRRRCHGLGPQHLVEWLPPSAGSGRSAGRSLGDVLQPVQDHQQRGLRARPGRRRPPPPGRQHGAEHRREPHRELGRDQVEHPLGGVVPGRYEQVHVVQRRGPAGSAAPVVEEQVDVGDGRDVFAQPARHLRPRPQDASRAARPADRSPCTGRRARTRRAGSRPAAGTRSGSASGSASSTGSASNARRSLEGPEQPGQPVDHRRPTPGATPGTQQRGLRGQEPVGERQEPVELVADLRLVPGRPPPPGGPGPYRPRWARRRGGQVLGTPGSGRRRRRGRRAVPTHLVGPDAKRSPGSSGRRWTAVDVGAVGAAEVAEQAAVGARSGRGGGRRCGRPARRRRPASRPTVAGSVHVSLAGCVPRCPVR